jgi:hypothetical protein
MTTVTIHALLHIADSIEHSGPVWTSWAYPMERFCGRLQRAVKGRQFVWASIDNWALRTAQAAHIRFIYHLCPSDVSFQDPDNIPRQSLVQQPPCMCARY